jgi:beta-ribofuranosylaminobenzene 5'-phosphate synthase
MIHIRTGSRLHFGLLSLPGGTAPGACWPNHLGNEVVPARSFGGVGLMVEEPGVSLSVDETATTRPVGGLASGRASEFADRFARNSPSGLDCRRHIAVERSIPPHVGLGSGTQLALAVARALNLASGQQRLDAGALAELVGRGKRSAVGIHGFEHGGFIVEGGRGDGGGIAPLLARHAFPEDWPVILIIPSRETGRHGPDENQMFQRLLQAPYTIRVTEAMCRLVLLGMLPGLAERNYSAFAEALFDFNARAGELFSVVQGGLYSSSLLAEIVKWLRQEGVAAAGQSSWGPTVFTIVKDIDRAKKTVEKLRRAFGLSAEEVLITKACNGGARISK